MTIQTFPSFPIEVKWLKLILTCSVDSVNSKKQAGNQNLSFIFAEKSENITRDWEEAFAGRTDIFSNGKRFLCHTSG
ncbi:MAG: hypothetical protein ACOX0J_10550 [Thermoactinomyces vulgaris]